MSGLCPDYVRIERPPASPASGRHEIVFIMIVISIGYINLGAMARTGKEFAYHAR